MSSGSKCAKCFGLTNCSSRRRPNTASERPLAAHQASNDSSLDVTKVGPEAPPRTTGPPMTGRGWARWLPGGVGGRDTSSPSGGSSSCVSLQRPSPCTVLGVSSGVRRESSGVRRERSGLRLRAPWPPMIILTATSEAMLSSMLSTAVIAEVSKEPLSLTPRGSSVRSSSMRSAPLACSLDTCRDGAVAATEAGEVSLLFLLSPGMLQNRPASCACTGSGAVARNAGPRPAAAGGQVGALCACSGMPGQAQPCGKVTGAQPPQAFGGPLGTAGAGTMERGVCTASGFAVEAAAAGLAPAGRAWRLPRSGAAWKAGCVAPRAASTCVRLRPKSPQPV
mmetsp:Transcript_98978/g.307905  ORF Transcript_98978/g.307905 Transcript_98978/m.307905 type:complete len:336 (-) Transcript_98978:268-1275(-)